MNQQITLGRFARETAAHSMGQSLRKASGNAFHCDRDGSTDVRQRFFPGPGRRDALHTSLGPEMPEIQCNQVGKVTKHANAHRESHAATHETNASLHN